MASRAQPNIITANSVRIQPLILWCCLLLLPAASFGQITDSTNSLTGKAPTSWPSVALMESKGTDPATAPIDAQRAINSMPTGDPRQANYDVLHYQLQFNIDPYYGWLTGRSTVVFTALTNQCNELVLDFRDGMICSAVTVLGPAQTALAFTRGADLLVITLPTPLQAGDVGVIEIQFWGHPQAEGLFGYQVNTTGGGQAIAATVSEPWSARSWWPCKDDPMDKASVNTSITVPPGYTGVSNGIAVGHTGNTWNWAEPLPIPTYLVSLAVSEYTEITDQYVGPAGTIDIRHFIFPGDETAARQDMSPLPAMLDFCGDLFGPYPFANQPLGIAECVWDQAMEHPTTITYGDVLLPGTNQFDTVLVHELAHMWFGDTVTPTDWTEVWLNEGFATYVEALWAEHLYGAAGLRNFMVTHNWGFDYGTGSLVRAPSTNYAPYYFRAIAYHKGAWVLHMLRHQLGDTDFFAALAAYLNDPQLRFGNANSNDFQRICETVSGQRLQVFFDQWLYRTTYPVLQVDWHNDWLEGANQLQIRVQQLQDPEPDGSRPPYQIPIEVHFHGAGIDTLVTLINYRLDQTFVLNLPTMINWISVDPDHWLLHSMNTAMNKSAHNVATAPVKLLPPYPNPFNPRTIFRWESEVPTRDLVEVFDVQGRRLLRRDLGTQTVGVREFLWLGADDNGSAYPSGTYLYRITTRGHGPDGDFSRQLQGKVTLAR